MQNILIYRHQLFKPSETFISSQAGALKIFFPIYTGRTAIGKSPPGSKVITMGSAVKLKTYQQVLLRNQHYLLKKIKKLSPVLIHAHFGVEGLYALNIAKALKIPLITTFHGFDATTTNTAFIKSLKPSWINYALFKKKLIRHGDLFICVSNHIEKKILNAGFPRNRVIRHYIGIDTEHIKPIPKQKNDAKTIIHVARLVEKKGTCYLIKAFARVAANHPNARLLIIGEGPLRGSLETLCGSIGLNNQVQFLGMLPNESVLQHLSKADVFCLPSVTAASGDQEGLGMVFLEAAALEVPAIGTLSGGIPEVIKEGETGFLVPEKDIKTLTERLSYLLDNHGLRKNMGKAARQMVETKFNLKRQTAKLEKLYQVTL